jgi:SAM-dependent methyltransferase
MISSTWLENRLGTWFNRFLVRYGLNSKSVPASTPTQRVLLHVGCGKTTVADLAPVGFQSDIWREVRLDANPAVFPDIVGSMVAMEAVSANFADAIYSSHNIEHLYAHEVDLAFAEFHRVLKTDGFLAVTCPDLQSVCAIVAEGKLHDAAYESPAGPISAIDMLYGHRPAMAQGNLYMAHRTGFTLDSLIKQLQLAGFRGFYGFRRPECFDLWLLASKASRSEEALQVMAADYLVPLT